MKQPADRNPAFGTTPVHCFAEARYLPPTLDRSDAHIEERGDLLVRALHNAKLFKFGEVNLRLRTRHDSFLLFEQSKFCAPVREREK
jgi:hypothetical protein